MSAIETSPGGLPEDLARQIGAAALRSIDDELSPRTMLDWAIRWAMRGLHLFPCNSFTGTPIPLKWFRDATNSIPQLVEWWSETPVADIAAVPDRSGHFVIAAARSRGIESLMSAERTYGTLSPVFTTETRWGDRHLWFKGRALTSHHLLGPGLHVYGPGTYVYMPASLAPDPE